MRIRYEEPVDKTNMSLLATIAVIIFGGIIAVNFFSISDSAEETVTTNLAFIPALLLIVVLIGVGYFNNLAAKKNLNQIISEYDNFSKAFIDEEKFKGFSVNGKELSIGNYKSLRNMPKNIAPYFVKDEIQSCK